MSTPPGPSGQPDGPNQPQNPGAWGQPPAGQPYPQQPPAGYPQQGYPQQGYPGYPGGGYEPGAVPGDPLVPAGFSGWVQQIVATVQRSLVPLLQIQLAVAVVSVAAQLLFGVNLAPTVNPATGEVGFGFVGVALLGGLILGLVSLIATIASVHVVVTQAAGGPADLGAALRFAPSRLLPMIGWGLLAGLITVVGFFLILLPGVYLACVFAATLTGVVVIERGTIGRCFTLFNNRFGPTLGRVLLLFLVALVYGLVTGFIANLLGGPTSAVGIIVQALFGILSGAVGIAAVVVTYAELRFHDRERPGALTPHLAAELNR